MRQTFFFLFFVVAFVASAPAPKPEEPQPAPIAILKSDFDLDPAGSYNFAFETENEINRQETGELKTVKDEEGKEQSVVVVRGSYSYKDADGNTITVNYYADETGFHPEGAHLPNVPGVESKSA